MELFLDILEAVAIAVLCGGVVWALYYFWRDYQGNIRNLATAPGSLSKPVLLADNEFFLRYEHGATHIVSGVPLKTTFTLTKSHERDGVNASFFVSEEGHICFVISDAYTKDEYHDLSDTWKRGYTAIEYMTCSDTTQLRDSLQKIVTKENNGTPKDNAYNYYMCYLNPYAHLKQQLAQMVLDGFDLVECAYKSTMEKYRAEQAETIADEEPLETPPKPL